MSFVTIYKIQADGKCLDIEAWSTDDGAVVVRWNFIRMKSLTA